MKAVKRTLLTILRRDFIQTKESPVTKANPKLSIGPISGEISMVPMMTGALLISGPLRAMRLAIVTMVK